METSFNLIDEPWIGAVDSEGQLDEYSLRDLLAKAHELRSLHDDSPLVVAALLRMILALLHRVFDGPRDRSEWKTLWEAGQFDMAQIDAYFAEWRGRFDLFDKEYPFYQTTTPLEEQRTARITILQHETMYNGSLFNHASVDLNPQFDAAMAARTLLTVPLYGFGGRVSGPSYFSNGPCARDILFFAKGETLFQTLILNLVEYNSDSPMPSNADDCPAWEQDNPFESERSVPRGYLDFLTWQTRQVRLVPESSIDSIQVREMALEPGLPINSEALDPMKHYRSHKKSGLLPLQFREERSLWRDSTLLFQINSDSHKAPAVFRWLGRLYDRSVIQDHHMFNYQAIGMLADRSKAITKFAHREYMPLPLAYLNNLELVNSLGEALEAAEKVASELWKATGTMASVLLAPDEDGDRRPDPDAVRNLRDSMGTERKYWSMLEPIFRQTMYELPENRSDAMHHWFGWLRSAAWKSFDAASDGLGDDPRALKAAVRGREQLLRGLGKVLKIESEIATD